jgi:type II secretory pathway pseudopilin PulG
MTTQPPTRDERGFALVIVLAGITVMMIMMGAAVPTWKYVMQDDREQELYFRGDQIACAIEAYQRKNANTFPPSFEVLVKGKYLRHEYKDPMVKGGKWRLVRPGEAVPVSGIPTGGASPRPNASPSPSAPPSAFGPAGGTSVGAIAGVASLSHDNSLRIFNGRTRYDQWIFLAGQPRLLGRTAGPTVPGAGRNVPGAGPSVPGAGASFAGGANLSACSGATAPAPGVAQ